MGSTWLLPQRPKMCFMCLMRPGTTWTPPREGNTTHGAVPALGLPRVIKTPMSPKSGWRLGSLSHRICPERCYLELGPGKGQLFVKIPARLSPLLSLGFRHLPSGGKRRRKVEALPPP